MPVRPWDHGADPPHCRRRGTGHLCLHGREPGHRGAMMTLTRKMMVVVVSAALAWQAVSPPALGASVRRTIHTGALRRTFVLHAPPSVGAMSSVPLSLALLGGAGAGRALRGPPASGPS